MSTSLNCLAIISDTTIHSYSCTHINATYVKPPPVHSPPHIHVHTYMLPIHIPIHIDMHTPTCICIIASKYVHPETEELIELHGYGAQSNRLILGLPLGQVLDKFH